MIDYQNLVPVGLCVVSSGAFQSAWVIPQSADLVALMLKLLPESSETFLYDGGLRSDFECQE